MRAPPSNGAAPIRQASFGICKYDITAPDHGNLILIYFTVSTRKLIITPQS